MGVDSFYSVAKSLRSPEKISHLLFVLGVENGRKVDLETQRPVIDKIKEVGDRIGTKTIVASFNLGAAFPLSWPKFTHGACLAGVALALASKFKTVLIPSTHPYNDIFPWGSSPLVDHLWSSEHTKIVHHGSEADRAQKIINIAENMPWAVDELRVCTKNSGGAHNCGACDKCIRTALTLHVAGLNSASFPAHSPQQLYQIISETEVRNENQAAFLKENIKLAKKISSDSSLLPLLITKQRRFMIAKALPSEGSNLMRVKAAARARDLNSFKHWLERSATRRGIEVHLTQNKQKLLITINGPRYLLESLLFHTSNYRGLKSLEIISGSKIFKSKVKLRTSKQISSKMLKRLKQRLQAFRQWTTSK